MGRWKIQRVETLVWIAFLLHNRTVHDKAEAIYTDELASYLELPNSAPDMRPSTTGLVNGRGFGHFFKRIIVHSVPQAFANHLDRYLEELPLAVQQPGGGRP